MTETLTTTDQTAAIGPGRLVLVVGPSGAGKDTLLGLAKAACVDQSNIVFPRRVITREASASEDNEEVSVGTFEAALARDEYAMHWEAHGHRYALSRAIDDDIRAGRTVVGECEHRCHLLVTDLRVLVGAGGPENERGRGSQVVGSAASRGEGLVLRPVPLEEGNPGRPAWLRRRDDP